MASTEHISRVERDAIEQVQRFASGFPGMLDIDTGEGRMQTKELIKAFIGGSVLADGSCQAIGDRMMRTQRFYPRPVDVWEAARAIAEEIAQVAYTRRMNTDSWKVSCELCQDMGMVIRKTNNPDYPHMAVRCICTRGEQLTAAIEFIAKWAAIPTVEVKQDPEAAYKLAARRLHPDIGGNHELFVRLQQAWNSLRGENVQ